MLINCFFSIPRIIFIFISLSFTVYFLHFKFPFFQHLLYIVVVILWSSCLWLLAATTFPLILLRYAALGRICWLSRHLFCRHPALDCIVVNLLQSRVAGWLAIQVFHCRHTASTVTTGSYRFTAIHIYSASIFPWMNFFWLAVGPLKGLPAIGAGCCCNWCWNQCRF